MVPVALRLSWRSLWLTQRESTLQGLKPCVSSAWAQGGPSVPMCRAQESDSLSRRDPCSSEPGSQLSGKWAEAAPVLLTHLGAASILFLLRLAG